MNTQPESTQIAVIGSGTLGAQIAFTMAAVGRHHVSVFDTSHDAICRATAQMSSWLPLLPLQDGKHTTQEELDGLLTPADSIEDAVKGAELLIEAIPEDLELKRDLFSRLSNLSQTAILATNSSCLKSRFLADVTESPHRLLNLHFFLEPWKRNVVELMTCGQTDLAVMTRTAEIVRAAKLLPILVNRESTGFVFNRIWRAIKRESLRVIAEEVGTPEDIDTMWRVIFESPVGPCEMMDQIGLDIVLAIERLYANESRSALDQPPPFLEEWVKSGRMGKKTGCGFFTYDQS